ncbi:general odorant-binding protein 56a-like [Lucilia cuprina]|uniref:general odorant-binding protein 56a-like n=1 Tax=Lucilia cuprina TaxID=7375 RepID=UPI001F06D343|nr:general odorant-binding protein 56a-like [Lucilia cuprina]
MKTIICHFFILVVVALSHNQQTEAAATNVEIGKKAVEECIKEGSLNGDDTSRIINGEIFSSKYKETSDKLKCFLLCYYKKIGVIGADGQQKPEKLMKYLQSRFPQDKDKIKPALAKCTNIKSSNPCEVVHKFEGCVIENIVGNK